MNESQIEYTPPPSTGSVFKGNITSEDELSIDPNIKSNIDVFRNRVGDTVLTETKIDKSDTFLKKFDHSKSYVLPRKSGENEDYSIHAFFARQKYDIRSKIISIKSEIFDLSCEEQKDEYNNLIMQSLDDWSNILIVFNDLKYVEQQGIWKVFVQWKVLKFLNVPPDADIPPRSY